VIGSPPRPSTSAGAKRPELDAQAALVSAGHRWTRQRQAVLDVLREAESHLDADQVYQLARRHDPRLSLSTVYRTLTVLRYHGLIHEFRLGEGHHHYEFGGRRDSVPDHAHLVCRVCTKVVEFTSPLLARLHHDLKRRYRFHFVGAQLELEAICEDCLAGKRHANGASRLLGRR
jgi:Fe2+ or Zn2+ uptake regulation protein